MNGVFLSIEAMNSDPLSSQLREMKSDWDSMTEPQKVENIISRVRLWVRHNNLSAAEIELAMDIGLNALHIVRRTEKKEAA